MISSFSNKSWKISGLVLTFFHSAEQPQNKNKDFLVKVY